MPFQTYDRSARHGRDAASENVGFRDSGGKKEVSDQVLGGGSSKHLLVKDSDLASFNGDESPSGPK
jgi:hypothetical protein